MSTPDSLDRPDCVLCNRREAAISAAHLEAGLVCWPPPDLADLDDGRPALKLLYLGHSSVVAKECEWGRSRGGRTQIEACFPAWSTPEGRTGAGLLRLTDGTVWRVHRDSEALVSHVRVGDEARLDSAHSLLRLTVIDGAGCDRVLHLIPADPR